MDIRLSKLKIRPFVDTSMLGAVEMGLSSDMETLCDPCLSIGGTDPNICVWDV